MTKRWSLSWVLIQSVGLVLAGLLGNAGVMFAAAPESAQKLWVYIGTYTGPKSQGIYVAGFDPTNGHLDAPELAAATKNPSFLGVHPNRRCLYAVGEVDHFQGQRTGAISAFRLDGETGKLTLLNQEISGGSGPCHLAVDYSGRGVLTANYGSGTVALLPIGTDGELKAPSAVIQHTGSSVNRQRQAGPHAHFITPDPANRFALACDLGLDKVLVYRLDPAQGSLVPNDPPAAPTHPGAGPRHLAFHPNLPVVYVLNEIDSTLVEFGYDAARGTLKRRQRLSTLPAAFKGQNTAAEVQVHPSGRFVYASNRGHDSIAVFAVDEKTGSLRLVGRQGTQGKTPRYFGLDPSGRWLLAANQDSNNIVVFAVDANTGELKPTGQSLEVSAPVCLCFVPTS